MLHEPLARYLEEVEDAIKGCEGAFAELYEEEILAPDRINLRIRLRYYNGYLLEVNESVVFEGRLSHLGYRYHFQDQQNNLVFRYDNTPHFPELKTFPDHKHVADEVTAAERPSIPQLINEAKLIAA
jgi:Family of unknown function (DUF6516)